jgi:hypothetical protein
MRPRKDKDGYMNVRLISSEKKVLFRVHRLVLVAFVGPCPEGHEACHNNGIRHDNRLENLRWGTPAENREDAYKHNHGRPYTWTKLTFSDACEIRRLRSTGVSYADLSKKFGISTDHVGNIVLGKRWKSPWR